ncbi:MAG: type II 3-dehydroquinate dehydratase [Chitinophagales bacterium]
MQIIIINGPNLNLLGIREPHLYGNTSFEEYFVTLQERFPMVELHYFQSNTEGAIIDTLHGMGFSFSGIILNPGAYAHTSVAIADAVSAIETPVIEVHISNTLAREAYRHQDIVAGKCAGLITGLGLEGYALAIEYFLRKH